MGYINMPSLNYEISAIEVGGDTYSLRDTSKLAKVTTTTTKDQEYIKHANGTQGMRDVVVANSTGTDSVVNVTADAARANTAGGAYSVAFGSRNVIGSSASESGAFGGDIHINSENTYGFGYRVWAHSNQNLLGGYDIGSNAKESLIFGNTIGVDCTHNSSTHEWTANSTADDNKSRYLAIFGKNHTIASDCQSDLVYGSGNNVPQYVYRSAIGGNGNRIQGALDNSFVFGQEHYLGSNSSNWINVFGYNNKIGLVSPTGTSDSYSGGNEDINVLGYQNRVGAYLTDSTVIGYYNKIAGGTSSGKYESVYAIGYENTNRPSSNTYQRVFMIGAYLRAEGNDRVIVGRYNDGTGLPNRTTNDGGTFFEVGCGYDSNNRATGFAVCHTAADGYHAYIGPTKIGGSSSGLKVNGTLVSLSGHTHDERYVRYDTASQGLTNTQKSNARTNIGAAASDHVHATTLVKTGSSPITIDADTAYTLTAGGSGVVFKIPAIPTIGTGATDAAAGNHVHGNINNSGTITSTAVTSATGVLVYDSDNKIQRATAANARSIIGAGTYSKPSGGIPDTDIASASTWNTKYTKPSGGIPATDLAESYYLSSNPNGYTSNAGTVIGSGLTADYLVLGNGTVNVKTSLYKPSASSTTWDASSDEYLPTMKAISSYVTGKGYITTDKYHTSGSWSGLTYTATANGGAGALAFTIQTGTTSTTVAAGDHTHTLSLAADSGTSTIDLQSNTKYKLTAGGSTLVFKTPAGGGGGTTLYRHNLEWVFKTGSSSSGYIYTHFYAYLITNSSTAYTYSTYFGSITTLFKKTVLCGGLYDYSSQEDYGYDGISTLWRPNYNKSGSLNQVYIKYARESSSTWSEVQITASTIAYSFTDTVETF